MTATGGTTASGGTTSTGGTINTGGATATGGTTATGGSAGAGCTGALEEIQSSSGLCVAKMATITAPSGSSDYRIDVTEVTQGQYDAWLAKSPPLPASTDTNCGWKTSYAPKCTGYAGTDADHHPVFCVDWCDAYAYCSGVGKRLCGAIDGGPNAYGSTADANASQWYRACSSGGKHAYPYGDTYQASYCNTGPGNTMSVGSLSSCVTSASGYAGVYDLTGNVDEWEDSCGGTGQSGSCHLRGGCFGHDAGYLTCGGGIFDGNRDTANTCIGFRCCSL
jgi:formylglycine-generating enzyme required for sulfatase activity